MKNLVVILGVLSVIQLAIGGCIDSCNSECSSYRCRRTCYNECQTPCNSCCGQSSCSNDCGSSSCKEKQPYISEPVYNVQPPSHSNITLELNNVINTVNTIDNPINVTTINVNNIQFLAQNDTLCCNIAVPQNCGHANCDVEIVYTCSEKCRVQEEQAPVYRPPTPPVYLPPVYQPPFYQPPVYQPPQQPVYIPQPMPQPVYIPQPVYTPVQQPCPQAQVQAPAPCPYG